MFAYAQTPTIVVVDGVASPEECEEIIDHTKNELKTSTVALEGGNIEDSVRTSTSGFFPHSDFPEICSRWRREAGIPLDRAEPMNVLRYTSDQEYKPHYDTLGEEYLEDGGQRIMTGIVYLNNAVGGGTAFPKLNMIFGSVGGRLLLFENVDKNMQPNDLSLHQGMPPHEGEKWVFTLWFREKNLAI
jgi:prolyl 4-hydroxylase